MKKIVLSLLLGSFTFFQAQKTETSPSQDHSRDHYIPDASKPAEYPGGFTAFRMEVSRKIRTNKIIGTKGVIRANARFSVSNKGEIEKVVVTGDNESFNREIENAVKSIHTRWKPEEYKGTPVSGWYNISFTFSFD
ncbi:energy transducer TonB [Chryseobacterium sp.]|uniref:energy transducer TonB n=1 Tax=Chryseobacterium sp. TaxID=1871047 RepID=UPI0025B7F6C1|nr:energy transducer TonB [Chryseobacterium sp.]MBV8327017.1 hypothetical protein [Chryseobacterium sp.]